MTFPSINKFTADTKSILTRGMNTPALILHQVIRYKVDNTLQSLLLMRKYIIFTSFVEFKQKKGSTTRSQ